MGRRTMALSLDVERQERRPWVLRVPRAAYSTQPDWRLYGVRQVYPPRSLLCRLWPMWPVPFQFSPAPRIVPEIQCEAEGTHQHGVP